MALRRRAQGVRAAWLPRNKLGPLFAASRLRLAHREARSIRGSKRQARKARPSVARKPSSTDVLRPAS